ncbi:spherulation-specific family 4 protein [Demequina sp. NBRC 110056]|uniref:spherulation-specific family 4 protein n=1 Tax=Demequina sp. NBRC 110056 TaxID=1570345 RepID=UPI0013563588|nr:spherulation-specific family 4 protein [Demequina sp. NBRC 110056]
MNDARAALTLAVPAYFHPAVAEKRWRRLVRIAPLLRFVIVNPHNGPGERLDPAYPPVIEELRGAGVRIVGYVDTDYGRCTPAEIGAEVRTFRERYGVQGVFMDQVSSGLDDLDHYAQCVAAARTAGAPFVVLNAGTEPHRGYVDLANVTVTFEGTWAQYTNLTTPAWAERYPASRFCHLVHSLPRSMYSEGVDLATQHHVGSVFLTHRRGDNPWSDVPQRLLGELRHHERAAAMSR